MPHFAKAVKEDLEKENPVCTWTLCHNWYEDDSWYTSCGKAFVFSVNDPEKDEYEFCPACGKTLVRYVPVDDNEKETDD